MAVFYEHKQSICGGNGLVYIRGDQAKPIWQCRLNVKGLKGYVFKSCKTQDIDEAMHFALELYDDLRLRVKQGLPTEQRTFTEFFESEWLPYVEKTLSIHRYRLYKGTGERYFLKYFKDKPLEDIKEPTIDNYWDWRRDYWKVGPGSEENRPGNVAESPSAKTLKMEQSLIHQMFRYSKRKGYISALPIIEVQKRNIDPASKRRPNFTLAEWEQLYKHMNKWRKGGLHKLHRFQREMLRSYICILMNSGLRPGEAALLKWKHIGFTSSENIKIQIPEGTKTNLHGQRSAIIPNLPTKRFIELLWDLSGYHDLDEFVFADREGKPMIQSHKTFTSLLTEAGLLTDTYGSKRTLYSLRHSYITFRFLEDVPAGDIARNCGTSESQIRKHYDHVANEMRESVPTQQKIPNYEDQWSSSAQRHRLNKVEHEMIEVLLPNQKRMN